MRPHCLSGSDTGAAKAAPRRRCLEALKCTLAFVVAAFTGSGCYRYSVIDPAQADAGIEVRARITPEESARIDELLGTQDRVLEGEIVGRESSGLILSVPTVFQEAGLSTTRLHQRLTLPTTSIVELEQRRLDRLRTYSLIGAVVAVAGYAVISQFGTSSDDPGGDKPGREDLIIPLRIPFP